MGNALSQYFEVHHEVLDKYETKESVIKEDIADFESSEKYDLIASISTLEHVGYDEYPKDDKKIIKALDNFKTLIKSDGLIVVTLPLGQNPILDSLLRVSVEHLLMLYYMKRISKANKWSQSSWDDVKDAKYGKPFFWC